MIEAYIYRLAKALITDTPIYEWKYVMASKEVAFEERCILPYDVVEKACEELGISTNLQVVKDTQCVYSRNQLKNLEELEWMTAEILGGM